MEGYISECGINDVVQAGSSVAHVHTITDSGSWILHALNSVAKIGASNVAHLSMAGKGSSRTEWTEGMHQHLS